jgi:hypothetical protein
MCERLPFHGNRINYPLRMRMQKNWLNSTKLLSLRRQHRCRSTVTSKIYFCEIHVTAVRWQHDTHVTVPVLRQVIFGTDADHASVLPQKAEYETYTSVLFFYMRP